MAHERPVNPPPSSLPQKNKQTNKNTNKRNKEKTWTYAGKRLQLQSHVCLSCRVTAQRGKITKSYNSHQTDRENIEIACWWERRTRDRKVASSNPGGRGGRIFFSGVNFVCWLLFGVRSTPVLLQWHIKDPGQSAKSAGVRLHLNTHRSSTQRSRSGLTRPLSRHSVGTYSQTSSHTTCQGTFGLSRLSSLSHCGLILAPRVTLVCTRLSPLPKKKKKE